MGISRQRPVPPEDWTTEEFMTLPPTVRATMTGLRMHADDQGRENANQRLLWSSIWPLSEDVTEEDLVDHLLILAEIEWLDLYSVGPRTYYQIVNWPKVDHGKPSRLPAPPSRTAREPLANDSRLGRESEWESESEWAEGPESPEGGRSRTFPEMLPTPFCVAHPNGINEPCRDCGTARLRHEREAARRRAAALREESP